jgi:hypothetical protein
MESQTATAFVLNSRRRTANNGLQGSLRRTIVTTMLQVPLGLQRRLPVAGLRPDDGLLSSGLKHLFPRPPVPHIGDKKPSRRNVTHPSDRMFLMREPISSPLCSHLLLSRAGSSLRLHAPSYLRYLLLSIPRTRAPPSHFAIFISQARGATSRHQTGETGTAATGMPAANRPPEARPQAPQNKGRGAQQARQETRPQIPIVQVFARQGHRLAAMQRMQPAQTILGSCWEPGACEPS